MTETPVTTHTLKHLAQALVPVTLKRNEGVNYTFTIGDTIMRFPASITNAEVLERAGDIATEFLKVLAWSFEDSFKEFLAADKPHFS